MTTTRDETFIDEASRESFPASDAPAWSPTHAGPPAPRPARIDTPRDLRAHLRADADHLAASTGLPARARARAAADLVATGLLDADRAVTRIPLERDPNLENVEARIVGALEGPELVIGAGLDPAGVAVLLGLARVLQGRRFVRGVRLVAFADDQPLATRKPSMGSRSYARRLHADRRKLVGMLSLDSVGFVGDGRGRFPVVPWRGDFVAVVGERNLVHEVRDAFRQGTELPVHGIPLPQFVPLARSSAHAPFRRQRYPAVMLVDPAALRAGPPPHASPGLLDYDCMSDVVFGLASVVTRLAGSGA